VPKIITNYNERFKRENEIYHPGITPTSIFRAFDNELNENIVLKELKKSKLLTNYMNEFAKNELAIHYSLSNYTDCENIVKVREYFENSDAYYMIMEYSPEPNFFEDLLEVVN
jgi:serine/threonine protein kinase